MGTGASRAGRMVVENESDTPVQEWQTLTRDAQAVVKDEDGKRATAGRHDIADRREPPPKSTANARSKPATGRASIQPSPNLSACKFACILSAPQQRKQAALVAKELHDVKVECKLTGSDAKDETLAVLDEAKVTLLIMSHDVGHDKYCRKLIEHIAENGLDIVGLRCKAYTPTKWMAAAVADMPQVDFDIMAADGEVDDEKLSGFMVNLVPELLKYGLGVAFSSRRRGATPDHRQSYEERLVKQLDLAVGRAERGEDTADEEGGSMKALLSSLCEVALQDQISAHRLCDSGAIALLISMLASKALGQLESIVLLVLTGLIHLISHQAALRVRALNEGLVPQVLDTLERHDKSREASRLCCILIQLLAVNDRVLREGAIHTVAQCLKHHVKQHDVALEAAYAILVFMCNPGVTDEAKLEVCHSDIPVLLRKVTGEQGNEPTPALFNIQRLQQKMTSIRNELEAERSSVQ